MRLARPQHIPALDGIRGLAVAMVVAFHLFGRGDRVRATGNMLAKTIAVINSYGWTGVSLFFVLSGFLITGILWDTRQDISRLRNFYARRTVRIFPLYYGTLLLVFLVAVANGKLAGAMRYLWTYLFYLQNQLPTDHPSFPISSILGTYHLWSLAVEEQFYLLWPLLVYRMRTLKQLERLCLLTFAASAIFKFSDGMLSRAPNTWTSSLPVHCGSLALGAYLACCYRGEGWKRLMRWAPWMMTASFAAYALSVKLPQDRDRSLQVQMMCGLLLISMFWAALVVASFRGGLIQHVFEMRWIRFLGRISYGLYVFHVLFITFFIKLGVLLAPTSALWQHLLTGFLGGLISIGLATLSFEFFEKPFYKLKQRFRSATGETSPRFALHGPGE